MKVFIPEMVLITNNDSIVYRGRVTNVYSDYESAEQAVLDHVQDWENNQRMYDPEHRFSGDVVWGTEEDDYYVAYDVGYNNLLKRDQEFRITIKEFEVE